MAGMLGTIAGQLRIDVAQALVAYSRLRAANAATITALSSISRTLRGVGTASLIAGAALLAIFGKAVKSAADFEKKIDFFGAVTNASQKDMKAVADLALKMGTTTTFSASQMADAFVEFGKAGISTKDILGGVAQAVVNLAQAADIPITHASDIIVSTMATFRLGAAQTAHIADVLAGAANASIIDIADIGTSLKYVGGIAATTGISLESTATAIALLGQAGIKGSTAGTSLRQMIVSLMGNSKAARKELTKLGIITKDGTNLFIDQEGNLKELSDVFQILQDHTKGLTNAQRLAALKIIFNNRALAAASILTRDGAKSFAEMNAAIGQVKAADVAKKRLDNLAGSMTKLKNTIETVFIQAGTPFQKMAKEIVDGITRMVQAFGNLSPHTQEMIFRFIEITGVALTVFGAFAIGASIILRMIVMFQRIRMVFFLVKAAISSMILTFRILMLMLASNPIGLVIVGLTLLAIAFVIAYKRSETFRNVVHAVGAALMTALRAIINFFQGLLPAVIAAYTVIQVVWDRIYNKVSSVIRNIINAVRNGFNAVKDFFTGSGTSISDSASNAFSGVTGAISGAFHAAVDGVKSAFAAIGSGIVSGISSIVDFVRTHWFILLVILSGPLAPLVLLVRVFWSQISAAFQLGFAVITGMVRIGWAIITTAFALFQVVSTAIIRITMAIIVGIIQIAWIVIKTSFEVAFIILQAIVLIGLALMVVAFRATFNFLKMIVSTAWNFIVGVFQAVFGFLAPIVATGWNFIASIISTALNFIVGIVTSVWNSVVGFLTAIGDRINAGVYSTWNRVASIIRTVVNAIATAVSIGFNRTSSVVRSVTDVIKAAMAVGWALVSRYIITPIQRASSAVSSAFHSILDSITRNLNLAKFVVNEGVQRIVDYFNSLKGKITGALSNSINLLVSAGEDMIRGMINGVGNMAGALVDKVKSVVSAPVSAAKGILGIKSPSTVFRDMGINIVQGLNNGLARGQVGSAAFLNKISSFIATAKKATTKKIKGAGGLSVALTRENAALIKATSARDTIAKRLAAANKTLASYQAAYTNVRDKVRDSILGSFDVTTQGADTPTGLLGNLQDQLNSAKAFAANIKNLAAKGVNRSILDQIAQKGVTQETAATINALTKATKPQIAQFNAMYSSLSSTALGVGTQIANTLYGAGVNAAKGLVSGLKSQETALTRQMNRIASQMVATIKRALGIRSPSTVFQGFGHNTVRGLILGIEKQLPALKKTMLNTAELTSLSSRATLNTPFRTSAGLTTVNNYEKKYYVDVKNPPIPTGEAQVLDGLRKVDILAGGMGEYGG